MVDSSLEKQSVWEHDGSSAASQALETYLGRGSPYFFSPFVKMKPVFVAAVLRHYSKESRKYMEEYFQLSLLDEDDLSFFQFIKKNHSYEQGLSTGEVEGLTQLIQEISRRKDIFYKNSSCGIGKEKIYHTKYAECVLHFVDSEDITDKLKSELIDTFYDLILLCHEASMEGEVHPFRVSKPHGRDFLENYLHLLMAFACRSGEIAIPLLYRLENITRQFSLGDVWFHQQFQRCICYSEKQRKEVIWELLGVCFRDDPPLKSILLDDCITLELLGKSSERDKLEFIQALCPDSKERQGRVASIKQKLKEN